MTNSFSLEEFEAARLLVACLAKHADDESFSPSEIGFTFNPLADAPCGKSDIDVNVTAKDFIRAAVRIIEAQFSNLAYLTEIDPQELVQRLGVAVAAEDPR